MIVMGDSSRDGMVMWVVGVSGCIVEWMGDIDIENSVV